jgi:hypothetical protein
MADDGEVRDLQNIGEIEHVLGEGGDLPRAHRHVGAKARRSEAAQKRRDRAMSHGMKGRRDAIEVAHIVGPAVQEKDGRTRRGPGDFADDVQQRSRNDACLGHRPSPEHLPLGRNRPSEKKMPKIDMLEHVLVEKVVQLFRNMLWRKT